MRHTVGLSLTIILVMGLASAIMVQQQRAIIRKAAEDRGLAVSRTFAAMGAAAVHDNLFRIQESLNQYLEQPDVLQIDFIDRDNMIMASMRKDRIGLYLSAEEWLIPVQTSAEVVSYTTGPQGAPVLVIAEPLVDDHRITAWVRLIFSLVQVREKELQAIERMALVTLALVIAGMVGVHLAQRQISTIFHGIIGRLSTALTTLSSTHMDDDQRSPEPVDLAPPQSRGPGDLEQLTEVASRTTELVQRQSQALQQSRALLQAVLDNTTAVIYVKDVEGRYMLINRQYANLFHVTKDSMIGKTDFDLFARDMADAFRTNDRRVITERTALELEESAPHDDGVHTYLSLKFPLCDSQGTPYAVCGISTDITQRKRAEEALHALTASLEEKVRERTIALERARDQAVMATQHKSEFLASMSHELRTPLNAVIGFSEVLLERMFGDLNAKQEEYLQDIYSSGRHLLALINDILDLAKVEAGRIELDLSVFHLPSTIEAATSLVRERAVRHRIGLTTEIDDRLGECHADERKIKQVLLNLLSNAIKFTPDGGSVRVTAKLVGTAAEIAVSDTGVGIPADDQWKVFEEFYRAKAEHTHTREGTGLGLSLAKRFVELHSGRIWMESTVGEGSTFTFSLPVGPHPLAQATDQTLTGTQLRGARGSHERR